MKPRAYSLPVSAVVALLREVRRDGKTISIYPRAVSNAFGEVHASVEEPLEGLVRDLSLEAGEGVIRLRRENRAYFETAWINISLRGKVYSTLTSTLPRDKRKITFELPMQMDVDCPQDSPTLPFDDALLLSDGSPGYPLYQVRDDIYRVHVDERSIPFCSTARLASHIDGPQYQVSVINRPSDGWVDVELSDQRWLRSPSSIRPSHVRPTDA